MQYHDGIEFYDERNVPEGAPTRDDRKFEDTEAVSTHRGAEPRCVEEG